MFLCSFYVDIFNAEKDRRSLMSPCPLSYNREYMPENHPEKPKNWFADTITRVQASVTAEVATGLGHEVSFLVRLLLIETIW